MPNKMMMMMIHNVFQWLCLNKTGACLLCLHSMGKKKKKKIHADWSRIRKLCPTSSTTNQHEQGVRKINLTCCKPASWIRKTNSLQLRNTASNKKRNSVDSLGLKVSLESRSTQTSGLLQSEQIQLRSLSRCFIVAGAGFKKQQPKNNNFFFFLGLLMLLHSVFSRQK